jgi:CheY-like chemotaxis protein
MNLTDRETRSDHSVNTECQTTETPYQDRSDSVSPRIERQVPPVCAQPAAEAVSSGTETILMVEDEAIVRELACRVLRAIGYTVLTAAHPDKALALSAQHDGHIDLLITDILMPGMRGVDLAEQIARSRPGIGVLYISGYTKDIVSDQGVTGTNWAFLPKPFTPTSLARKVREALGQAI